jgi:hypothetical protein
VDAAQPTIRAALGIELGGQGIGEHSSLAQNLARELSARIKRASETNTPYPVEVAFISNEHLTALTYKTTDGAELISSLTGRGRQGLAGKPDFSACVPLFP